ncbi:MAG: discoidin domain-containing protein [Opitutus sp.]
MLVFLVAYILPARATVYYIDTAGSNANNGTSTSTPWKDFTNVNAMSLSPGDQVLLKRGGVWNGWLQIHGSGAAGSFITIGAYGSGNRPRIARSTLSTNTNVADRCLTAYDPSYLKIEHLEVCNAGAGIVIHYDNTYDNQSVYIDDIYAHDFYGIKFNAIKKDDPNDPNDHGDPYLPDNNYYFRGTNGWENVTGPGQGPGTPGNPPTYWAPDHVATSAGVDLTGDWDRDTHPNATQLNDFKVTNSEFSHCGNAIASDWQHWTDREWFLLHGQVVGDGQNKVRNMVLDNVYIHDMDAPWISVGSLLLAGVTDGVIKNSLIYKGVYFASGGTSLCGIYFGTNLLFDNITVKTTPYPTPSTTDLSIADLGGTTGLEIRNSTFENVAGYGFGFLQFSQPYGAIKNINLHDNTFINTDWHFKNIIEVFHTVGSWTDPRFVDNRPEGTINSNYITYVPPGNPADPTHEQQVSALYDASGRWNKTTFYSNDEIQTTNRGRDLALGKTTTARMIYGAGFEASKATDGNESTYWASPYMSIDPTVQSSWQWIKVDLGAVYSFNEIQLWWQGNSYAQHYEDQISLDDVTWETVFNHEENYNLIVTDDTFTTRKARYVRILLTQGNIAGHNPPNFGLWSFHVYNSDNLASGAPATASSTTTSARLTADYAVDNNDSSQWQSGGGGTQTLEVDLGQAYNINEVCTNWGTSYAAAYSIQVSSDHSSWPTVKSVSGVTSPGVSRDVFTRTNARYVRITMTQTAPAVSDYSIREMRVYSARNAAQDKVVSASSTSTTMGFDPWRAVDTNGNTRWSSATGAGPGQLTVDLGQVLIMNEFIINWDTAYATDYNIETSPDNSAWTSRVARTGLTAAGTTVDKIAAIGARYVRINMTQGSTNYYSINNFGVYNDMARGSTCTASSTLAGYPLSNAVDTSDTSRWSSTVASGTRWFKVNLGGSHTIDRIMIDWDTAYAKDYTIAVSSDDINYTTVATRTGIRVAGTTDDKIDTVIAGQYVKVTMTSGYVGDPTNYSINSISVYGAHP